jgi:hypothetical protein
MEQLKASIKTLAAEKGASMMAIITELQTAAAVTSNDTLLDQLCELKSELLGI